MSEEVAAHRREHVATEIPVRDPRTGAIDHVIHPPSPDDLAKVALGLREMQTGWEQDGIGSRIEAMMRWREAMEAHRGELVDVLVRDTGRRIESELEVDAVLGSIERWCRVAPDLLADPEPRTASIPFVSIRQSMRPYVLAGVISPWNFPLLLSLIDAIPALLAGCAVMVKPSEITQRFIEPLARMIPRDLPLAFIEGAGETGSALVDLVDVVCFTGSVPTGRRVGEQAAKRFIPAFLELGGKDPAVVLASADIDRATSAILWGSTANAGQSCLSIERIYVEAPVYETFMEQLVAKAHNVTLAHPTPESGQLGPIIAQKQVAVISDHLADAVSKGAHVHCGGEIENLDGGSYCRATVLTDVDHSMRVMTEETFGPIMPVMKVADADEAVRMANDTSFGLSAAVFAGDPSAAVAVARRIDAGAVSINDAALTALIYDAEKNSFNLSGLGGSRMGPAALRRFGRRQAFLVAEASDPDPWWYPPT